jgi:hypothetical protein
MPPGRRVPPISPRNADGRRDGGEAAPPAPPVGFAGRDCDVDGPEMDMLGMVVSDSSACESRASQVCLSSSLPHRIG